MGEGKYLIVLIVMTYLDMINPPSFGIYFQPFSIHRVPLTHFSDLITYRLLFPCLLLPDPYTIKHLFTFLFFVITPWYVLISKDLELEEDAREHFISAFLGWGNCIQLHLIHFHRFTYKVDYFILLTTEKYSAVIFFNHILITYSLVN